MADTGLLVKAAHCYTAAGAHGDAARCYRAAGHHMAAGQLFEKLGRYDEAATAYVDADLVEEAAWLLATRGSAPEAAIALLARPDRSTDPAASTEPSPPSGVRTNEVLHGIIRARVAVAVGRRGAGTVVRQALDEAERHLADPERSGDPRVEAWAVALAEAAQRFDRAACLFAAGVRAGRRGTTQRWDAWSRRVLGVELRLPADVAAAARADSG